MAPPSAGGNTFPLGRLPRFGGMLANIGMVLLVLMYGVECFTVIFPQLLDVRFDWIGVGCLRLRFVFVTAPASGGEGYIVLSAILGLICHMASFQELT
jgi:hypothetical protein